MKNNQHQKIINFISEIRNSHESMVAVFTKGSCLNFHLILREVYPKAIAYYDFNHIITKIDNRFYDINGSVLDNKKYVPFSQCFFSKKKSSRVFSQMYNEQFKL